MRNNKTVGCLMLSDFLLCSSLSVSNWLPCWLVTLKIWCSLGYAQLTDPCPLIRRDNVLPRLWIRWDAVTIKLSVVISYFSCVVLFSFHIWLIKKGSPQHCEWDLWGKYPFLWESYLVSTSAYLIWTSNWQCMELTSINKRVSSQTECPTRLYI